MRVVGGKLGQGFEDWRVLTEDADVEADANHVELYMEGGFFKDAAMLFEKVAWYRYFPPCCTTGTRTGNILLTPASRQGHNYNQARKRFYP